MIIPAQYWYMEVPADIWAHFNILGNPKTLLPVKIDDECFVAPPNMCVEKKNICFWEDFLSIQKGTICLIRDVCRNRTILNIFDDVT